jgi:hypothetical protein
MKDRTKLGATSLGALGLLATLLTALGSERIQGVLINHRTSSTVAVVTTVLAVVLTAGGILVRRDWPMGAGLAFLLIGLVIAGSIVIDSAGEQPKASIEVSAQQSKSGIDLIGTVKASGLRYSDHIRVEANLVDASGPNVKTLTQTPVVYQAELGPDASGKVRLPFRVPLYKSAWPFVAVRAWTTDDEGPGCDNQTTGCVILRVLRAPAAGE